jgi:threonine/homoserine/homoserine lactone efflux protein
VNRNRFEVIIFMGLSYLTWMQWNTFWAKSIFSNDSDEPLEITYSYWDGAGHRRVIQVRLHPTFVIYWRAFNFFLINIVNSLHILFLINSWLVYCSLSFRFVKVIP